MESITPIEKQRSRRSKRILVLVSLFIGLFISLLLVSELEIWQERFIPILHRSHLSPTAKRIGNQPFNEHADFLDNKLAANQKRLDALQPTTPFIIVNTTGNDFKLFNSKREMIREGLVSTGSFTILRTGTDRQFVFKTPRGQLRVLGKTKDPVWKRPDWAFIEEGLKVPSHNHPSRYEYGTLGDYSLNLGDGYLIHGTLYKRFLGLPVTHGCIRMGDEDLELVFKTLQIGSRVYIY